MPDRSAIALPIAHAAVAVAATWPLALATIGNHDRLPLGTETSATVPLFNLWTLRWGADHLLPFGSSYWNAPIFAPHRGTFAWSEPQPLTSWVFAVVRHINGDVTGYALVLLAGLTLNGVAGALLARRLGAARVPAALVGATIQVIPFAMGQMGVLQLTMLSPLLFALAALVAWWRAPTIKPAVELGVALAAAALVCGNTLLLFAIALAVVAPAAAYLRRDDIIDRLASAAVAAGIVAAIAGPVVIAQQSLLGDRQWRAATVLAGSASWSDWSPGGRAWPGWWLLVLAAGGIAVGRHRRISWMLVALAGSAVLVSFGSRTAVLGWHPWNTAVDVLPSLGRLRSPWRAAVVTQLCLAATAVPLIQAAWDRRRPLLVAGGAATTAIIAATGPIGAGTLAAAPSTTSAATRALAARHDGGAVVALPFAPGPRAADFEPTVVAMLAALDDGHPLVNGYSGFFPSDHTSLRAELAGFPDATSLAVLADHGARYVVADPAWLVPRRDDLDDAGITVLVDQPGGVLLLLPT